MSGGGVAHPAPGAQGPARLGRAASLMALGTLISRLTGFAKLVVLIHVLGFTYLDDAYNLANTTPNVIYDLVAGGILASTVVPVFVDRLTRLPARRASRDLAAVCGLSVTVMVLASVGLAVVAPVVIRLYDLNTAASASVAAQRIVAVRLLRLFALQVLAYGVITLLTALLNAKRRFGAPAFAPIANNLVVIAVLLACRARYGPLSLALAGRQPGLVTLLGLGTTAGVAVQAAVLLPALRSAGLRLRLRWEPRNPAVRDIVRLSGWTLGFVLANQVAMFVVLSLAHGENAGGGATAWTSAYSFFQLPFGILAVSVMNALEPELAEHASRGDLGAFRRRLGQGLRATIAVIVPATVGYLLLARPLVKLVLSTRQGTAGTGALLVALVLGLPGFCAFLYLIRAWQALRDTRTIFGLYLLENALNVALAFLLTPMLGLFGLGLSYSAAYGVTSLVAAAMLRRARLLERDDALRRTIARVLAASLPMAAAILVARAALPGTGRAALVAQLLVAVVAGAIVLSLVGAVGAARLRRRGG